MKEHQEKLEEMLSLLINEEEEAAHELFHSVVVEKGRSIWEEVLGENIYAEEEEVDEKVGGDPKADFADEIEADKDEIDAEEAYSEADDSEEDDSEEDSDKEEFDYDDSGDQDEHETDHEDVEDRVEDLEAALAELTAEFEELVGDDVDLSGDMDADGDETDSDDEDYGDEIDFDDEMEMGESFDDLEEATEFLKKSADTGQRGQEGKYSGTGDKSEKAVVNTKSTYNQAKRKDYGGEPVDFAGGDEKGTKAKVPGDESPEDNVDVDLEKAPQAKKKPDGDDKSAKSPLSGVKKNK